MTDTVTRALLNPGAADLGSHSPKPTATTPGLTEATLEIWSNGKTTTGLWEATAGTFTATRVGYSEICLFISGTTTVTADGEEPITYGPGDIMVMPSGWAGVWEVHEPLRKHFTIIND